jgi:hypothetical protein
MLNCYRQPQLHALNFSRVSIVSFSLCMLLTHTSVIREYSIHLQIFGGMRPDNSNYRSLQERDLQDEKRQFEPINGDVLTQIVSTKFIAIKVTFWL